jgi:hypothetical protein
VAASVVDGTDGPRAAALVEESDAGGPAQAARTKLATRSDRSRNMGDGDPSRNRPGEIPIGSPFIYSPAVV